MDRNSDFRHVRGFDHQWHSICLDCFLTAGEADHEDQLKAAEDAHMCEDAIQRWALPKSRDDNEWHP